MGAYGMTGEPNFDAAEFYIKLARTKWELGKDITAELHLVRVALEMDAAAKVLMGKKNALSGEPAGGDPPIRSPNGYLNGS